MATPKNAKRTLSDVSDDSGDESHRFSSTFPRCLVIKSTDENKTITKLSPFLWLRNNYRALFELQKSVKSLKYGTLLVEISSENLFNQNVFFEVPVKIYAHLYTVRIIRCRTVPLLI